MQMVMLEPDAFLADRRERGADRRDEVWDGVLHLAPPPTGNHSYFANVLRDALVPIAHDHGLIALLEAGVPAPERPTWNYRTPDIVVCDIAALGHHGVLHSVALVIEVLSPNDESRKKFAFYAQREIAEYWLIDPVTLGVEVYSLREGAYHQNEPGPDGNVAAPRLGLTLRTVADRALRIARANGSYVDVSTLAAAREC